MNQLRNTLIALLFSLNFAVAGQAAEGPPALQPDHPQIYTVQPGDTLWEIAGRFLRDPWRWQEIWEGNPGLDDPHRIYPGDVLQLSFRDGLPRLGLQRRTGTPREVKLTPHVRRDALTAAIPTIPIDAVQQFLTRPRVVDRDDLEAAPYVLAFVDEHIVGGAGDPVYVRAVDDDAVRSFDVVRPGVVYKDPDSGEELGEEAEYIGDAELLRTGDPAKLMLVTVQREVQIGDRLLPDPEQETLENFQPRPAPPFLEGHILSVLNGVDQIGQFNVVAISKGGDDGLEPGHVMKIFQGGELVRDQVAGSVTGRVALPLEEAGVLMVFRVFDRVSFALIMGATQAIHVGDTVRSPEF